MPIGPTTNVHMEARLIPVDSFCLHGTSLIYTFGNVVLSLGDASLPSTIRLFPGTSY